MTARSLLLEKLARDCAAEKEAEVATSEPVQDPKSKIEQPPKKEAPKKAAPKKTAPKKAAPKKEIEKVEEIVEIVEIEKIEKVEPDRGAESDSDSEDQDFEPLCFHPPSLSASSNFTFAGPITVNIHVHF